MHQYPRRARVIRVAIALSFGVIATSCTAQEVIAWTQQTGIHLTDEQVVRVVDATTIYRTTSEITPAKALVPSDAALARLAKCESTNNPRAVSKSGTYLGLYQFSRATWNGVAKRAGRSDLVGVAPNHASPADQDAMARALYRESGRSPWPVCGRKI